MKITEIRTAIENLFTGIENKIEKEIKENFGKDIEATVKCHDLVEPPIYYLKIESKIDKGNKNYFVFFVADSKDINKLPIWECNIPIKIKDYIKSIYI